MKNHDSTTAGRTIAISTIDSGPYKWFSYFVMGTMCLMGIVFSFFSVFGLVPLENSEHRNLFILICIAWTAFAFYLTYIMLLMPTKITINSDGSFVLSSPVRKLTLRPNQIKKIDCSDGDWLIWHNNKKSDLRNFKKSQLLPFFRLVQSENPDIVSTEKF